MIIFLSDLHINFNPNLWPRHCKQGTEGFNREDPENIWKRVEEDERFQKLQPLVMTCICYSEKFSEYIYIEPKLVTHVEH